MKICDVGTVECVFRCAHCSRVYVVFEMSVGPFLFVSPPISVRGF